MRTSKFPKKIKRVFIIFTLIIASIMGVNILSFIGQDEVKAAGTLTESDDKKYSYLAYSDVDDKENPTYEGYLFAGWYTSTECTTEENALEKGTEPNESCYAKFVKEDTLRVLAQATAGEVTNTNVNSYKGKYILRLVSSVDSLDYRNVGFRVSYQKSNGEMSNSVIYRTKDVFTRIVSSVGDAKKDNTTTVIDTYSYSPKAVCTKSEYFITGKITLDASNAERTIATNFKVEAFWETLDGTSVYGESRWVSWNDSTSDNSFNLHLDNTITDVENATTTIKTTLNLGSITVPDTITNYYGPIYGYREATLNVDAVYYITGTTNTANGGISSGTIDTRTEEAITGKAAASSTGLNFQFADTETEKAVWATVDNSTPILAAFKEGPSNTWYDISWYDESYTEYTLYDKEDLYGFAKLAETTSFADKTIYLGADIVMNEEDASTLDETKKPTYSWIPIGKKLNATGVNSFKGTFDGQGYSISGIYVNETREIYNGLFARVENAVIKNLKLQNSFFYSEKNEMGSIVGRSLGMGMDSVEITDDVYVVVNTTSDSSRLGGMVGYSYSGYTTMNNCEFAGTVINQNNANRDIGGLLGVAGTANVTLSNCLVTGTIDASNNNTYANPRIGGLVGWNYKSTLNIKYSVFCGEGKVGTYTSNEEEKSAKFYAYLGLNGNNDTTPTTVFTDLYYEKADDLTYKYTGSVTGNSTLFPEDKSTVDYTNSLLATGYWSVNAETYYPELISSNNTIEMVADKTWYNENETNLTISTRNQLYGFMELAAEGKTFANQTVTLANDIIINSGVADDWGSFAPVYTWIPIGLGLDGTTGKTTFAGTFDGNNHTISGLYHDRSTVNIGGLFRVSSGTIQNLNLENSYFKAKGYIGAVVGQSNGGTLTNVTVGSDVTVESVSGTVGGMIGYNNSDTTLNQCTVEAATITSGGNNTGGLVGNSVAGLNLSQCYVDANTTITSSAYQVGGIIGLCSGNTVLTQCWNAASVIGTKSGDVYVSIGGMIGSIGEDNKTTQGVTMSDCLNTGRIVCDNAKYPRAGGIVGHMNNKEKTVSMERVLNSGAISVSSEQDGYYGSIFGRMNANTTLNISQVYACDGVTKTDSGSSLRIGYKKGGTIVGTLGTAIMDDMAEDGALTVFADLFGNTPWVHVANSTPTLDVTWANDGRYLSSMLEASRDTEEKTLTAVVDAGKTLTITDVSEQNLLPQGGWTDDNGYHYQAFKNDDKVYIAKFDNNGALQKPVSNPMTLYHANDVTYNADKGYFVVCHSSGDFQGISIVTESEGVFTAERNDMSTIEAADGSKSYEVGSVFSLDYDSVNKRYAVGLGSGQGWIILNDEFKAISDIMPTAAFTATTAACGSTCTRTTCAGGCTSKSYNTQGMACDSNYVYFVLHKGCAHGECNGTREQNTIAVYDWSGNFVSWINLGTGDYEPENISIVKGDIYFVAWKGGISRNEATLYKISKLQ